MFVSRRAVPLALFMVLFTAGWGQAHPGELELANEAKKPEEQQPKEQKAPENKTPESEEQKSSEGPADVVTSKSGEEYTFNKCVGVYLQ